MTLKLILLWLVLCDLLQLPRILGMSLKQRQPNQKLLTEQQMRSKVLSEITPVSRTRRVKVDHNVVGSVCALEVPCPTALPAASISMMDGYAVNAAELPGTFREIGFASAGEPFTRAVAPGECVRIATGAWVPDGLSEVVPIENVSAQEKEISLPASTNGSPSYIRQAGSEIKRGESVIGPRQRITERSVALLCGLGIDRIEVFDRPAVAVLSTGDELRHHGAALEPGAIYDTNRPMLLALLERAGVKAVDLGVSSDDPDELREILLAGSACDAIITSGAASVGERDYLKDVVEELGCLTSWQVAIKPGKPFVLGRVGSVPLFGLPGNPSSAFVTYWLLVSPALGSLAGGEPTVLAELPVVLDQQVKRNKTRDEYLRGSLANLSGDDPPVANLQRLQGSGSLATLAGANCLVRVPHGDGAVTAGEKLRALLLETP